MSKESASVEKSYKELSVKRSSIKGQITKFKNYLSSIALEGELSNIQLTELNLRLAKFESLSIRFDDLQNELDVLNSANISDEIEERYDIEQDIILSIATAKELLQRYSMQVESNQRRSSVLDNSCCVGQQEFGLKLPQIQIAKFNGEYFRWLEFRDTFESLIHKNERIPNINKFHYLMSYLEGDAARIISNLEISSANYIEAWKLLCNRFNNKRILINQHLNSLFNIRQLPRESERSLRFLVDHVTKNLRALASLGQPTDKWDILIIFMLSSKLDSTTLLKWEEFRNGLESDVPTLDHFFKFMIDRADVLEAMSRNKSDSCNVIKAQAQPVRNNYNQKSGQNTYTKSFASSVRTNNNNKSGNCTTKLYCIICNENHKIYDCPTFKSKGVDARIQDVTKYKLCLNCLRQGHPAAECRLGPCRECKRKHNSLLHRPSSSINHHVAIDENEHIHEPSESIVNFSKQCKMQVLLSTAMIEVSNPLIHRKVKVRALLDCGSQSSFITESLKTRLSLNSKPIDSLKVIGIGNNAAHNVVETCNIQIKSLHSNFNRKLSCLILKELTGSLPKAPINISSLNLPRNIQLADPSFNVPGPVDMLIGADIFWDILINEQRSLGTNKPKLLGSKLGWVISGPLNSELSCNNKTTLSTHAAISCSLNQEFANYIKKFSDLEEVPNKIVISENERMCEEHFMKHTKRDDQGRFQVKLPLKETSDCLGDSYRLARKRFGYLEKRLKRNPTLKTEYVKFIREYAELGHLSRCNITYPEPAYYLCHHAVLKQESESTKLRVVFDGSAATTSGYSLNDLLVVGPNVQNSLFSILIRARQYKYLLTGDIEKMYRQVMVSEQDRSLQLILWREDECEPIETLMLNTLTYGTASASYLSTRCLVQLAKEQDDELIKEIIHNDFYVDDLITGADDENTLRYIQNSVSNALLSGCFNLRKYKTNHPSIFKNVDMNQQDNLIISESTSTLGLGWTPSTDTFHFPVKTVLDSELEEPITKRSIMSSSFKLFDPLGLLSPVIIQPKVLLQKLWQLKSGWDEPVNNEIKNDWVKFSDSLKSIHKLHIPRWILADCVSQAELHSFSDASQSAYGACIYVVSRSHNGDVTARLLCAKSKVAPAKPTTIPRLELCAALLSARLCNAVLSSIRYKPKNIVHWCDSSVVLSWIKTDLSKLKTFVANRVGEIVELTSPASWRYVPTSVNPADLISRGVDAGQLLSMDLWWSGPEFLRQGRTGWPLPLVTDDNEELIEVKTNSALLSEPLIKFEEFSSFNRLRRSFAFVLRFLHNARHPKNKRVGSLSADELRESFHYLCAMAQKQSFSLEHELLNKGKPLSNKSKILSLSPFLSDNGLIRVGGRLFAANCDYEKKHPILLHASHQLTKLYFAREHLINFHSGPQLLLAQVRQTVWPVNGRLLARRTVSKCVICRRFRGKTMQPIMGNLPSQRVNPDFPFLSVGVDYAGPFFITNRKGRGARLIKCYLCLFVCLRFKCIHLEAVSDLTSDAFIMTLRRFIARRGRPAEIFSDNGRNFVAASKEISSFIKESKGTITDFASEQGIKFVFIPAYAPHFGGIWEAGVKSAKHHLRRVIGNSNVTFEEISTLFAQVEAILNSRPLCPLSSSPNDLLPLTPGHFIIGRPMSALPSPALQDCNENQLTRYERLARTRQHFWHRWQKEYLSELQQRTKWRTDKSRLNLGDMVLISEDNAPPMEWRLGRILRLIPGQDDISRVADIHTARGTVRRALTRICPLPTVEDLRG